MPDNLTRAVLIGNTLKAWGLERGPSATDVRRATEAVDEMIDALRGNPQWAKGLGIGEA